MGDIEEATSPKYSPRRNPTGPRDVDRLGEKVR
jgi:hypothetical protein